jgi:hypothetical protein
MARNEPEWSWLPYERVNHNEPSRPFHVALIENQLTVLTQSIVALERELAELRHAIETIAGVDSMALCRIARELERRG